ncbi:MAG: serine/threonine-protein kinase, partial [Candidatus Xenobia bacterium]
GVTPAVDQVLARMMAPMIDSRYHSIGEAGKALSAAVRTVAPHPYNSSACLICGAAALPPDRICRNCMPIEIPTAEVIPVKAGPAPPAWNASLPKSDGESAPVPEDRKVRITLKPPPSLSKPLPPREPPPPEPEPTHPKFPLLGVLVAFGVLLAAGGLLFLLRTMNTTPIAHPSSLAVASSTPVPDGPDAPPIPSGSPDVPTPPSSSPAPASPEPSASASAVSASPSASDTSASPSASASAAPASPSASASAASAFAQESTPAGTVPRPSDWVVKPEPETTAAPGGHRVVFYCFSPDRKYFLDVQMYDGMNQAAALKAIKASVKHDGGRIDPSGRHEYNHVLYQIYDCNPKFSDGSWSSTNYLISGPHATIRYEFAWARDADPDPMADLAHQILDQVTPQD